MCHSFKKTKQKVALKAADFDQVTDKNKLATFVWPTVKKALSTL